MKKNFTLFMLFFFLGIGIVCAQTIRYVKPAATGTGDGSTWANASGDLQAMIDELGALNDVANPDKQVWMAKGTYLPAVSYPVPSTANVRYSTFRLRNKVNIYGGFDGTDNVQTIVGRNLTANKTILSGNIGSPSSDTDNAYHVVTAVNLTNSTVLDGLTITKGYGDLNTTETVDGVSFNMRWGAALTVRNAKLKIQNIEIVDNYSVSYGGAIHVLGDATNNAELIFDKCLLENNRNSNGGVGGGAMYALDYTAITITNTVFNNNRTPGGTNCSGGAIYIIGANSSLSITNTQFINNTASGVGGAIYLGSSVQKMENLLFYNNTSVNDNGGAIYLDNKTFTMTGATFYKNSATTTGKGGGAIYYNAGSVITSSIYNSLFIGNTGPAATTIANLRQGNGKFDVYNSVFNGTGTGTDKGGIVTDVNETDIFQSVTATDPNFLRLKEISTNPAIDKGLNSAVTTTTDLDGNNRTINATALPTPTVDMGAYETQATTLPVTLLNFTAKANGKTTVLNWVTTSETDNQYFILEHSTDGKTFEQLAKASSKGNQGRQYHYTDYAPFNGNNYYRLSQVDKDGTTKLLGEQVVKHTLNVSSVTIYPNPVADKATILFGGVNYTKLELIDSFGRLLQSHDVAKTSSQASLDLSTYPKGIYFVRLTNGSNAEIKKIIK